MTKHKTRKRGDRVLIVGSHPWKGHSGTISSLMNTPVGKMWKVDLDNGISAGARDKFLKEIMGT